jgi:hypothetical protein
VPLQLQSETKISPTVARVEFGGDSLPSPTWKWSIYPDAPLSLRQNTSATLVSAGIFDVTLPESFLYLWVTQGATTYGPFDITVMGDSDPHMVAIGEALRDRLTINLPEIEFAMQGHFQPGYDKVRVIGYKQELDESTPPWIVISTGRKTPSPAGIGSLMDNVYSFTIVLCATVSDQEEDRTPAATAMMDSITDILNRAYYRDLPLPTGCSLGDCRAVQGSAEMAQTSVTGGYRWYSFGKITWQGKLWVLTG